MDHAALLEVLEAMKAAEVDDRIRLAAQTIYQVLIDAELTHVIEMLREWQGMCDQLPHYQAVALPHLLGGGDVSEGSAGALVGRQASG